MTNELLMEKVRRAVEYADRGDPIKDVIDRDEIEDALRLLVQISGSAHEPSSPHGGKTIECSRCNRSVLLPYVDASKEHVYITPVEGWVTDSSGNFCPQCNGQRTTADAP